MTLHVDCVCFNKIYFLVVTNWLSDLLDAFVTLKRLASFWMISKFEKEIVVKG